MSPIPELNVGLSLEGHSLSVQLAHANAVENVATADRLRFPREIALIGDAVGSARFDGSQDIEIYTDVARLSNEEIEELLQ